VCDGKGVPYTEEALHYLANRLYDAGRFEPKGCYPRDLVQTIVDWAEFHEEEPRVDHFTVERAFALYLGTRLRPLALVA
jgi:hypothetical protein